MPTFEVAKAEHKKTFTGKQGGEFDVWTVNLKDSDGMFTTAEMVQKQGTPEPAGQVEGELDTSGPYAAKFKRAQRNGFGGGGRPMSPKKEAEIRRLACQKSGVALLVAEVQLGKEKPGTVSDLLKARIDWLEKDCIEAGEKAS